MQHRRTRQRERILEVLRGADTHPAAEWIYARLKKEIPRLSMGTVYRNLGVLVAQGEVQRIPAGSGQDRYEARMSPHYHLVCDVCGAIVDIDMPQDEALNRAAEKHGGFKVLRHRVDFYGVCGACQKKRRAAVTPTKQKGR